MTRCGLALLFALTMGAAPLTVPEPPKSDLPYLVMGDDLIPTEAVEATPQTENQGKRNEETTYSIPGEHAAAKTPLVSPVFAIKQDKLELEKLSVYPFQVRNGKREITFSKKAEVSHYTLTITNVSERLYRMEVNESLPPGEYAVTPSGSNEVFAFAVK